MEAAAAPIRRRWITARLESDGHVEVSAHAQEPFGGRDAVVHIPLPASDDLTKALEAALESVADELSEQAGDAVSTHRIYARLKGEPFREPATYAGGRLDPPEPQPDRQPQEEQ